VGKTAKILKHVFRAFNRLLNTLPYKGSYVIDYKIGKKANKREGN